MDVEKELENDVPSNLDNQESENPTAGHVRKPKLYQTRLFAVAIMTIICVCVFWLYQTIVAHVCLQGFWHISGDYYVLIDESLIRFIKLKQGGDYDILLEDTNVKFTDRIAPSLISHSYTLTRSNSDKITISGINDNIFNDQIIHFEISPATGVIEFEKEGSIKRLIKDNAMSLVYLSSRK